MTHGENLEHQLSLDLKADDRILFSILENLNSGVALIDDDNKFILYNKRFLNLFGLPEDSSVEDVNDLNWGYWQFFNENKEILHMDFHPVRSVIVEGKKVKNQLVGVKWPSGGDVIWMLICGSPLLNENGKIEKTVCTYLDITKQVLSNLAFQESEQRYRSLVKASSEVLYRMSPNWDEMLQLNSQGFLANTDSPNSKWLQEYILPDDQPVVTSAINEAIRNKSTFVLEHRVLRADGSWGWTFSRAVPLLDYNGEIIEWFGAASDITRRKQAEEACRENEEKFSAAFRSNPNAIVLSFKDGTIIDVNDAFEKLFERTKEELEGKTSISLGMFVNDEDRENLIALLEKDRRITNYEIKIRRRSGEERIVLLAVELIQINFNEVMVTTIQDITERKQMEARLNAELYLQQKRSAELNAIVDSIPEAFYYGTGNGITQCNSFGLQMVGANSLKDLQGLSIEDLYTKFNVRWPDSGQKLSVNEIPFLKALDGEVSIIDLLVTHQQTGKDLFIRSANAPVLVNGEIVAAIVINSDLTERKQIEVDVRTKATEIEAILSCIADGVLVYDKEGRIVRTNSTADRILQYADKSESKLTFPERLSKGLELWTEDGHRLKNEEMPAFRAFEHAETIRNQILHIIGRGVDQWLSISAAPLIISENHIGAVVSISDINKRKAYEKVILDNENRLKELHATKDKLLSIISHDIKSPFTSIVGFSELLIEKIQKKDLSEIEHYASMINTSSWSVMNLLTNLIEWSRLQTGRINFCPSEIDMISIVNEVIFVMNASAYQKSISISTKMPDVLNIFADKLMIGTVLRNLISNAIKFTHASGQVVVIVTTDNQENSLIVEVSDNGSGMGKEVIENLFNPESNISRPGTQRETGTGLGLIICKEFILRHNGKIWVDSKIGKGSTFYFTIPKITNQV